jgi:plasmid stabilization system protein ParE
MPQGDKSAYTDKQKRKAEHIEEGYEDRGVSDKEAERRAWATVNKESGGGKKSGSGPWPWREPCVIRKRRTQRRCRCSVADQGRAFRFGQKGAATRKRNETTPIIDFQTASSRWRRADEEASHVEEEIQTEVVAGRDRQSDAMDLEGGVFKQRSAKKIADSLKHSAEESPRRKASAFQSAMSMLTFYINRAGKQLSKSRLATLDRAKDELRKDFGKDPKP